MEGWVDEAIAHTQHTQHTREGAALGALHGHGPAPWWGVGQAVVSHSIRAVG